MNIPNNSTQSPQSVAESDGKSSPTATRPQSSSSSAAGKAATSARSAKRAGTQASTRVGSRSSKPGAAKSATGESGTDRLVLAQTLNWVLAALMGLGLVEVGKASDRDYYEIRLPTRVWNFENGMFGIADAPGEE